MIISEKQLIMLVQILKDSLVFDASAVFSFDYDLRKQLIEQILNQQSSELKEVK